MPASSVPTARTGRAPTAATRVQPLTPRAWADGCAIWRAALPLLVAVTVGLGAVTTLAQPRPLDPAARVYLVPLGAFSPLLVLDLVAHHRAKLGLALTPLPPIPLESSVMDRTRQQVVAEDLVALVRAHHPTLSNDVVIGLTAYDMHIRTITSWEWAFSFRDGRTAVVATARMDPLNWGAPPDDETLRRRLRKMVAKNLGMIYYGLGQSSDPRSVLFGPILSVDDLDRIGEEFGPVR